MFRARTALIPIFFVLGCGAASVLAQNPAPPPPPTADPAIAPKPKPRIKVQTPQPSVTVTPVPSVGPIVIDQTPRPQRAPRARTPEPAEPQAQSGPVTAKLDRGGKVSINGPLSSLKITGREGDQVEATPSGGGGPVTIQ